GLYDENQVAIGAAIVGMLADPKEIMYPQTSSVMASNTTKWFMKISHIELSTISTPTKLDERISANQPTMFSNIDTNVDTYSFEEA
ncbi:hypothetical protein HN51_062590, partial [Arachis hypogaea]